MFLSVRSFISHVPLVLLTTVTFMMISPIPEIFIHIGNDENTEVENTTRRINGAFISICMKIINTKEKLFYIWDLSRSFFISLLISSTIIDLLHKNTDDISKKKSKNLNCSSKFNRQRLIRENLKLWKTKKQSINKTLTKYFRFYFFLCYSSFLFD